MIEGFGLMDSTYFIGRQELLKWINDLLKVFNLSFYQKRQMLKKLNI